MTSSTIRTFIATCYVLLVTGAIAGEREDFNQRFERARQRSIKSERSGAAKTETYKTSYRTRDGRKNDVEIPIVSDDAGDGELELMVKVWAQLRDGPNAGKYVNLVKYQWSPDERLYLYMKPATPIQFTLYQVMEDSSEVKVMPRDDIPTDLMTIKPDQDSYRFPIPFRMDANRLDEDLTLTIVRAGTGLGDADTAGQGGFAYRELQLRKALEAAHATPKSATVKLRIKADVTVNDSDTISSNYEDVMIGFSKAARNFTASIKLSKIK